MEKTFLDINLNSLFESLQLYLPIYNGLDFGVWLAIVLFALTLAGLYILHPLIKFVRGKKIELRVSAGNLLIYLLFCPMASFFLSVGLFKNSYVSLFIGLGVVGFTMILPVLIGLIDAFTDFEEKMKKGITEIQEAESSKNSLVQKLAKDMVEEKAYLEKFPQQYKIIKIHTRKWPQAIPMDKQLHLLLLIVPLLILIGLEIQLLQQDYSDYPVAKGIVGRHNDDTTPVFRYTYQNETYELASSLHCPGGCYRVGEEFNLLINPKNPKEFIVDSFLGRWFWISFVGFLAFMLWIRVAIVMREKTDKKYFSERFIKVVSIKNGIGWMTIDCHGEYADLKCVVDFSCEIPNSVGEKIAVGRELRAKLNPHTEDFYILWDF
jgi:hypothetical protein